METYSGEILRTVLGYATGEREVSINPSDGLNNVNETNLVHDHDLKVFLVQKCIERP